MNTWNDYWEAYAFNSHPLAAVDWGYVPSQRYRNMSQMLVQLLDLKSDDRLLTLGCGTGQFERHAYAHVHLVIGLDFIHQMLRHARANNQGHFNIHWIQAHCKQLPLRNAAVNKALAFSVTHYLELDELVAMLYELKRVTSPGARILLGDIQTCPVKKVPAKRPQHRCQAGEIKRLFQKIATRVLLSIRRVKAVPNPFPLNFFPPEQLLDLARQAGLTGKILFQGKEALAPNRYNFLIYR